MFYIGFKHKSIKARRPDCGCLLGDVRSHAQSVLLVRGVMHSQFSWSKESCTVSFLGQGSHARLASWSRESCTVSSLGQGSHAQSVFLVKGVMHVWCLG